MQIKNTRDVTLHGCKMLVYGQAGAGKTTLCSTLPNPIILSAESGLLSLRQFDLPYIQIKTIDDLTNAYHWALQSEECKQFDTIALDSISEIGEAVLNHEKKHTKDPRQAYGAMAEQVADIIRCFRDLPGKHVYFSSKLSKIQDETGRILYGPSMPGKQTGQAIPYFFDEVLALRVETTPEGQITRALQTQPNGLWEAKDRSGCLAPWEEPHLGRLIEKIQGGVR